MHVQICRAQLMILLHLELRIGCRAGAEGALGQARIELRICVAEAREVLCALARLLEGVDHAGLAAC
jgi:hypothetical protein